MVSWERQTERGMASPRTAGLVVERYGDAEEWVPREGGRDRERSETAAVVVDNAEM